MRSSGRMPSISSSTWALCSLEQRLAAFDLALHAQRLVENDGQGARADLVAADDQAGHQQTNRPSNTRRSRSWSQIARHRGEGVGGVLRSRNCRVASTCGLSRCRWIRWMMIGTLRPIKPYSIHGCSISCPPASAAE